MDTTIDTDTAAASNLRWYVVQARSGFEKAVAKSLRERMQQFGVAHAFGEVLVPSEEVTEMRDGQKRKSERKFFPGYVLVQIATEGDGGVPRISSEAWHLVRETSKVSGFIGGTAERPLPITDQEADRILARVAKAADKPTPKVMFERGTMVRVTEGPFNDFNGVVEDVDYDRSKIKVSVLVFGRATPVDFDLTQVERA